MPIAFGTCCMIPISYSIPSLLFLDTGALTIDHMYICECMREGIYVCTYVCTYVRMYVCMHVCRYVCMYA